MWSIAITEVENNSLIIRVLKLKFEKIFYSPGE
jgi:hypothetical protein